MVIFTPATFGLGNIYRRVRNVEKRLMVVSDLSLVAGIGSWWCKTTNVKNGHLTDFRAV